MLVTPLTATLPGMRAEILNATIAAGTIVLGHHGREQLLAATAASDIPLAARDRLWRIGAQLRGDGTRQRATCARTARKTRATLRSEGG
jgi:hypothetical protein